MLPLLSSGQHAPACPSCQTSGFSFLNVLTTEFLVRDVVIKCHCLVNPLQGFYKSVTHLARICGQTYKEGSQEKATASDREGAMREPLLGRQDLHLLGQQPANPDKTNATPVAAWQNVRREVFRAPPCWGAWGQREQGATWGPAMPCHCRCVLRGSSRSDGHPPPGLRLPSSEPVTPACLLLVQ